MKARRTFSCGLPLPQVNNITRLPVAFPGCRFHVPDSDHSQVFISCLLMAWEFHITALVRWIGSIAFVLSVCQTSHCLCDSWAHGRVSTYHVDFPSHRKSLGDINQLQTDWDITYCQSWRLSNFFPTYLRTTYSILLSASRGRAWWECRTQHGDSTLRQYSNISA